MANPYEPAVAREHLVNNFGFASLMRSHDLCKNLPLLNMILPLYSEQTAGATNASAQASKQDLTRAADLVRDTCTTATTAEESSRASGCAAEIS